MTKFLLETGHGNPWPEPGDVLESAFTGNRWRVLAVVKVKARKLHDGYHSKWRLEVERAPVETLPVEGGRVIEFSRWQNHPPPPIPVRASLSERPPEDYDG